MRLIALTLATLMLTASAMAAEDCRLSPDKMYLVNPNAPAGGACTKSCRYDPAYEDKD